jgi:mono/diheme cytochrome c family protein
MGFIRATAIFSRQTQDRPAPLIGTLLAAGCLGLVCSATAADRPPEDAAAVERGAQLYQQYCTECHGRDGRAQMDVISDATDLTMPGDYYSGSTEEEIYNSIANGAGVAMPAWRPVVGSDEAVWDLVYYVKSLWAQ